MSDELEIEDGFGSIWELCDPHCSVEVVRPGKAQCHGLLNDDGWPTQPCPWGNTPDFEPFYGPGPCKACGHDPACGFAQMNNDWYCHDDSHSCFDRIQTGLIR